MTYMTAEERLHRAFALVAPALRDFIDEEGKARCQFFATGARSVKEFADRMEKASRSAAASLEKAERVILGLQP